MRTDLKKKKKTPNEQRLYRYPCGHIKDDKLLNSANKLDNTERKKYKFNIMMNIEKKKKRLVS